MNNTVFDHELIHLLQRLFDKIYDSHIKVRGSYKGTSCYVLLPVRLIRGLGLNKGIRFNAVIRENMVVYEEDPNGEYDIKNYGRKDRPAYYIRFPIRKDDKTPVKIIIDSVKPLRFYVVFK